MPTHSFSPVYPLSSLPRTYPLPSVHSVILPVDKLHLGCISSMVPSQACWVLFPTCWTYRYRYRYPCLLSSEYPHLSLWLHSLSLYLHFNYLRLCVDSPRGRWSREVCGDTMCNVFTDSKWFVSLPIHYRFVAHVLFHIYFYACTAEYPSTLPSLNKGRLYHKSSEYVRFLPQFSCCAVALKWVSRREASKFCRLFETFRDSSAPYAEKNSNPCADLTHIIFRLLNHCNSYGLSRRWVSPCRSCYPANNEQHRT